MWEVGVSSVASPSPQYILFDAMYPEEVLLGGGGCCRDHGAWQRSRERGVAHPLGGKDQSPVSVPQSSQPQQGEQQVSAIVMAADFGVTQMCRQGMG